MDRVTQYSQPTSLRTEPPASRWSRHGLVGRLLLLALLFVVEKLLLDQFVDFGLADAAQGLGAVVRAVQHGSFRFLAVFGASLIAFAMTRERAHADEVPTAVSTTTALQPRWVLVHSVLLATLAGLSHSIYRDATGDLAIALIAVGGVIVGAGAVVSAFLALSPLSTWLSDMRSLGTAWIHATIIAALSTAAIGLLQALWHPAATLTFYLVAGLLEPVLHTVQADPQNLVLGTRRFAVQIADACSGLEGIGLMVGFCVGWLIYFRREYVFPRSIWIVPIGIVIVFGLNAVRIATLLLIGQAGFPDVAMFGFHSEAGWIAFIIAACAVVLLSRRALFLQRATAPAQASTRQDTSVTNATTAHLMPLLAILAAGMLSRALSSGHEALYPLRFVAGLAALLACGKALRHRLDWRCTWRGPVAGAAFGTLAALTAHLPAPIPAGAGALVGLPHAALLAWIASSWAAGIAVQPIAEELAYRGFLMRRISRADFDSMPFTSVRWPALCVSAVASAALQGHLFVPATLAGLVYGALVVHRGKFGEAVAAHASANAVAFAAAWRWTG